MHITIFFAGVLLCNSVPHIAAGLRGEAFPTPFAKPRGRGPSSPLINFYWGMFNLLLGAFLISGHPPTMGINPDSIGLIVGALAVGTYLALHFGRVRKGAVSI